MDHLYPTHPWLSAELIVRLDAELARNPVKYNTPGWKAICGPYGRLRDDAAMMYAAAAQLLGLAIGQDRYNREKKATVGFDGENLYRASGEIIGRNYPVINLEPRG